MTELEEKRKRHAILSCKGLDGEKTDGLAGDVGALVGGRKRNLEHRVFGGLGPSKT